MADALALVCVEAEDTVPLQMEFRLRPHSSSVPSWESRALAWFSSLPGSRRPVTAEVEAWLDSAQLVMPEALGSISRPQLHQRILALHESRFGGPSQVPLSSRPPERAGGDGTGDLSRDEGERGDGSRARFQRAEHWNPVYAWLESLETDEVVSAKEVKDWFLENPDIKENLSRNSRYHLLHYIQRVHMKILRRKGRSQKGVPTCKTRTALRLLTGGLREQAQVPCNVSSNIPKENNPTLLRKNEAFLRYRLLTDLQNQLVDICSERSEGKTLLNTHLTGSTTARPIENMSCFQLGFPDSENMGAVSPVKPYSHNTEKLSIVQQSESSAGLKRKGNAAATIPAWSSCEASFGNSATLPTKNIARCLQGREFGSSWALACCRGSYSGRSKEKLIPFLQGWRSLGRRFEGPAVLFEQRSYSSWLPTWCAYTSSAAVAQPFGRTDQSVQKVLDIRFHPEGLAQLVCSSNEAPNELLLYNLLSGKAFQLAGHNCQIQAVEFAVRGASIVSCGGNLMKVWDATTGSCLFTLGPVGDEQSSVGHRKKINAMAVNTYQSCLVVTSGGLGDGKLLLWNALSGELTADLNMNVRSNDDVFPSIEAMEFCSQNVLVCGTDSTSSGPAIVQLWDIESPQSCSSVPANDSYITCLKTSPGCNTIITGAGDGAVDLYDIRTCGAISHLSVGSNFEVTSVGFSKCGTYIHASSTSNSTLVWDTRLMPMNCKLLHVEKSYSVNDLHYMRPLHCLSHGKQMPTAEHAGQLPGHVDEGNQGVNDAKWLQMEPVLVTVSGDGSIAMWDVTLGRPCIRHMISHTRCVNIVSVAPNDEYLCSGGDDQKVVLYHNMNGIAHAKWRLSNPLADVS